MNISYNHYRISFISYIVTVGSITYRELIKEDLPRILDDNIVPGNLDDDDDDDVIAMMIMFDDVDDDCGDDGGDDDDNDVMMKIHEDEYDDEDS